MEIEIYQKRDYEYELIFEDEDTSQPIDISGWTIRFMAKKDQNDADEDAVIDKEVTILNPTGGISVLNLSDTDTDIDVRKYFAEFAALDSTGKKTTIIAGRLITNMPTIKNV